MKRKGKAVKRLTCLIGLLVICLISCSETTDSPQVSTPPAFNSQSSVEDSPPGFGDDVTVERNNPAAVDEKDLDEFLLITPGHSAFGVKIGDTLAQVADVHKAPFEMKGNFVEGHELHYDVPKIGLFAAVYESRSKAIYWDGRNEFGETVASGVYFYHLSVGDYSQVRRMVIVK